MPHSERFVCCGSKPAVGACPGIGSAHHVAPRETIGCFIPIKRTTSLHPSPSPDGRERRHLASFACTEVARPEGFEPPALGFGVCCSIFVMAVVATVVPGSPGELAELP